MNAVAAHESHAPAHAEDAVLSGVMARNEAFHDVSALLARRIAAGLIADEIGGAPDTWPEALQLLEKVSREGAPLFAGVDESERLRVAIRRSNNDESVGRIICRKTGNTEMVPAESKRPQEGALGLRGSRPRRGWGDLNREHPEVYEAP